MANPCMCSTIELSIIVTDASHNDTGDNVGSVILFLQDSFALCKHMYLSIYKLQI